MRLAILSDVHANLEALRAVLGDMSARQVDRIVCLGDIVGYNADPAACIALLRESGALCVAGNHDRAVAGLITTEGFGAIGARAIAWTRARLDSDALAFLAGLPLQASFRDHLVAVHGILRPDGGCERTYIHNDERRLQCFAALAAHPSRARVCAFGHTHHLGVFELRGGRMQALMGDHLLLQEEAHYLVNPGSVGQPRTAERRATYLVLDTGSGALTVHRVGYDARLALAKARQAGLAPGAFSLSVPARAMLNWGRAWKRAGLRALRHGLAHAAPPSGGRRGEDVEGRFLSVAPDAGTGRAPEPAETNAKPPT